MSLTGKPKLRQLKDVEAFVVSYGEGIIESGSNNNGKWIKFRDGTMICWNSLTHNFLAGSFDAGFSIPLPFVSLPIIMIVPSWESVDWSKSIKILGQAISINATDISFHYENIGIERTQYIFWKAIGRWKA